MIVMKIDRLYCVIWKYVFNFWGYVEIYENVIDFFMY